VPFFKKKHSPPHGSVRIRISASLEQISNLSIKGMSYTERIGREPAQLSCRSIGVFVTHRHGADCMTLRVLFYGE